MRVMIRKDVEVSNLFALKSAYSLVLMRGRMAFPVCLLLQRQALKRDKNFAETEPLRYLPGVICRCI